MVSTGEASTNAMVLVHHTGHAVKPEAVEMVHFHPEAEVAEQETHVAEHEQHWLSKVGAAIFR